MERGRLLQAEQIMARFASRTGLDSEKPQRRYLWTDAFAVCNFLSLARATQRSSYLHLALQLVDAVHTVLGRHRDDDRRTGWLSGLSDTEAALHPTLGGLRIGKRLPERSLHEPFDERLEWDRDGQYFHYLTKWMHALDQLARHTESAELNLWARELARAAHAGFIRAPNLPGGHPHLFWKMSIDLSRPLVPSMGQHDPLDGYITLLRLRETAARLEHAAPEPNLETEVNSLERMLDLHHLATVDPLGLGGLLADACRVAQLNEALVLDSLLDAVLGAAVQGLRRANMTGELRKPADHRLAFRELGLAIGLAGVALLREQEPSSRQRDQLLAALERYLPLGEAIESFWLEPSNQATRGWNAHLDINEVMLAASLVPEGFLRS